MALTPTGAKTTPGSSSTTVRFSIASTGIAACSSSSSRAVSSSSAPTTVSAASKRSNSSSSESSKTGDSLGVAIGISICSSTNNSSEITCSGITASETVGSAG